MLATLRKAFVNRAIVHCLRAVASYFIEEFCSRSMLSEVVSRGGITGKIVLRFTGLLQPARLYLQCKILGGKEMGGTALW